MSITLKSFPYITTEIIRSLWNNGSCRFNQLRYFSRKVRRNKATVEPLSDSPNSIASLLGERNIPQNMDLRDIWEQTSQPSQRLLKTNVDSTTRFDQSHYSHRVRPDNELMSTQSSIDLSSQDINHYYELKKGLIQEAFREFYKFTNSDGASDIPKRGCKALYDEVTLTGTISILYRKCMQEIREMIADSEPCKIWLEGKSGSGKSITLVSIVEWARMNNWFVVYVPSAIPLVSDFFFTKRKEQKQYDTIVTAKDILRSIYGIYGGDSDSSLSSLECTLPMKSKYKFGNSLEEVCKAGLTTGEAELSCEALITILNEVIYGEHAVKKMLVIDDYNALYWKTKYFHWEDADHKEMIPIEQVTLANSFRVLDQSKEVNAHILAASTYSEGGISPYIHVPRETPFESIEIPYLTEDEISCVLYNYWKCNLIHPIDLDAIKKLFVITGGSMHDLKRSLSVL